MKSVKFDCAGLRVHSASVLSLLRIDHIFSGQGSPESGRWPVCGLVCS